MLPHEKREDVPVHPPTTVKGERVALLQPITRESLFAHLSANGEDIGLCLLGPPKLRVGIPGHRKYFLYDDNRHIVLPNRCDPTRIAQLALLGNKKRQETQAADALQQALPKPMRYSLMPKPN
jgi:hypothetical protein